MSDDFQTPISVKEYFEDKLASLENRIRIQMDERDIRYNAMFGSRDTAIAAALAAQEKAVTAASTASEKAVNAALAAQEKAVSAAAEASEKAIAKAETAQHGVNERGNEFRKSLDDYTKIMMPRVEADGRFKELIDRADRISVLVEELRRAESRGEGGTGAVAASKQQSNWIIALVISSSIGIATVVVTYLLVQPSRIP